MRSLFLNVFLLFLLLMLSCMKGTQDLPSRVAIVDSDGNERTDFFLLPGMTQRLSAGAFVPTLAGEQFIGAPEASNFLGRSVFQLIDGELFVTVGADGCVYAKAEGEAQVQLSVESISKGTLDAFARVHVLTSLQSPPQFLVSGVQDMSVARHRTQFGGTQFGERFIGVVTEGSQGDLFFHLLNEQGLASSAPASLLSSAEQGTKAKVVADEAGGGFFVGFAKRATDPQKSKLSITEISRDGIIKNIATANEEISIRGVDGEMFGVSQAGIPLFFALSGTEPRKFKIFIFSATSSGVVSSGFLTDSAQGGSVELVLNDAELAKILEMAQLRGDRLRQFHLLIGKDGFKNQLKFISFDSSLQTNVELIPQATPDQPHAFYWDIFSGVPKVIFIQGERLLFAEKKLGTWVIQFTTPLAEGVDSSFQPRLIESREDGTLSAVWKEKNSLAIHFRISRDGGKNWSLPFFHAAQAFPSRLEGIPSSCGGSALMMLDQNKLELRFFDDIRKSAVAFPLATIQGSLKKVVHFRDADVIKLFFLDDAGLHLLVIP